ncbi:MAG: SUMF1/EgtB/PvdO family nonheme iron enzyme, partial [Chloroflexi bacterium]|nr:SUMF1/EgtB/PvdO family nonheme iron enzyme [Chloroflexota bacterium]
MKTFSPLVQLFFLGLLGVLLAACGTFEVYVEQPEAPPTLALPATVTPGSLSATSTSAPATTMPDAPDSAPTLTLAPFATPTLDLSLSPTPFPALWSGANDSSMALIPAGPFVMGSNLGTVMAECDRLFDGEEGCLEEWFLDETPVHTVTLSAFYIDRYEVTN